MPDGSGELEDVEVLEDVRNGHQPQDTQEPQSCQIRVKVSTK